jgi:hypothetical protein
MLTGKTVVIGGVMEHIEQAGVHSAATRRVRCRRIISSADTDCTKSNAKPPQWQRALKVSWG